MGISQYASGYTKDYPEDTTYGYDVPSISKGVLLKSAAIMAGVMVVSPFIAKGANSILSKAGSSIASYIGKNINTPVLKTGMLKGIGDSYKAVEAAGKVPTLGSTIRNTKFVSGAVSKYRTYLVGKGIDVGDYNKWREIGQRMKAPEEYIKRVSYGHGGAAATSAFNNTQRAKLAYKSSQYRIKMREFWKDRHSNAFKGRLVGHIERYMTEYAKTLPGMFVADKAIGFMTGDRPEGHQNAWWNIPGHMVDIAGDFAKTAVGYLPAQIAFSGIHQGARLAGNTLERALRAKFLIKNSKKVYNTASVYDTERVKAARERMSYGYTGAHMPEITTSVYNPMSARTQRSTTGYKITRRNTGQMVYNAAQKFDEILNRRQVDTVRRITNVVKTMYKSMHLSSTPGSDDDLVGKTSLSATIKRIGANIKAAYYEPLHKLQTGVTQVPKSYMVSDVDKIRGSNVNINGAFTEALFDSMSKAYGRPKMGPLSKVLGIRPARYGNNPTVHSNIVEHLVTNGPSSEFKSDMQREIVRKWIGNQYFGRGVFQAGDKVMSFSEYTPRRLFGRAIDWATENVKFHVPVVGTLKVLEFFRAQRIKDYLLQEVPPIVAYKEGDIVRVGPLRNDPELQKAIGTTYEQAGATVKLGRGESIFRFNVGWNKGRAFHVNTNGEVTEFKNVPNFKIVKTTTGSTARQVNALYYGGGGEELSSFGATSRADLKKKLEENMGWGPLKSWMHAYLLRTPSTRMTVNATGIPFSGFEIGAGYSNTGIFGRMTSVIGKFFYRDSPLVNMSMTKGFLKDFEPLLHNTPSGMVIEEFNSYNNYVKFLNKVRGISDDAMERAVSILKRGDISKKLGGIVIEGTGGTSGTTLGDIFGDTAAGKQKLINTAHSILGRCFQNETMIGEAGHIKNILGIVERDDKYLAHIVNKAHGVELTYADELRKFTLKHHLITQARNKAGNMALTDIMKQIGEETGSIPLTRGEGVMIRAIDNLANVESLLGYKTIREVENDVVFNDDLIENVSLLNKTLGYLMKERQNLEDLSKVFYKPWSTYVSSVGKYPSNVNVTTSPYEMIPSGGGIAENIERQGADVHFIKKLFRAIKSEVAPRYLKTNNWGSTDYLPADEQEPISGTARFATEVMMRFNRLGAQIGMGLNLENKTTWQDMASGVFKKIVFPAVGVYSLYKAADTLTDSSPLFANTSLDEGITVALGEQLAKQDLRIARVADFTGATDAAKYMEGLMPGSANSPLVRMGIAFGPTILGAAIGSKFGTSVAGVSALAGLGLSSLAGFGLHDFTKTREELKDVYSGRELVPVRKSRYWSMSRSPWIGDRIGYFRPHWIPRLKSQYQYTPDMWGSKVEEFMFRNPITMPLGIAIDPYHWERKWYNTAPYPETAPLFEDVPFVGPVLSATAGRLIKPVKRMHREELENSFSGFGYANDSSGIGPGYFPDPLSKTTIDSPFIPATVNEKTSSGITVRRPYPVSSTSLRQTFAQSVYRLEEMAGLWGWGLASVTGGAPFKSDHIIANANNRASVAKQFWDLQLGESSEYFRRFVPRQNYNNNPRWNPLLAQAMPTWLPGGIENRYFADFRTGSVWDKIPESTLRLPGWGNMAAYNVRLTMPMRSSQLGRPLDDTIRYMTGTRDTITSDEEEVMGIGTQMHRMIQDELRRQNLLVKAEAPVYDPYSDISGTIDAIVRKGRKNILLEIKTKSTEDLERLSAPEYTHRSQVNFYLKTSGIRSGEILYVSRDDPSITKAFPVTYNPELYIENMATVKEARTAASRLLSDGYGHPGEAYSHIDRLRSLGDVAPYSEEYQRELQIVNLLDKLGFLSPDEHNEKIKVIRRRKATSRTFDMYPRRFTLSQVFHPDAETQILSENEYIKAGAEYSFPERVLGGVYEYMTHQRSPIHTKLIGTYSPREMYERNVLYGSKYAFWDQPYRDFIEPYMRASFSTDRPDEGIIRGAQAGYLLGGPAGAVLGAGVGSVYGTVNGAFRFLTGTTYIPRVVKNKYEIADYFDNLEYIKARRLYQETGDSMYADKMGETMVGLDPAGRTPKTYANIARAVPYEIKPYIFSFINETNKEERERIAKEVPDDVEKLLRVRWAINDKDKETTSRLSREFKAAHDLTEYFKDYRLPEESNLIWHPQVQLEDVMLKTVKKEGLNAYEFGIGWYSQLDRISRSPLTPGPINFRDPLGHDVYPERNIDQNEVRRIINGVISRYGGTNVNININITPGSGSTVNVTATVDSGGDMIRMVQ